MNIKLWLLNKFIKYKDNNEVNKLKDKIFVLQTISVLTYRKLLNVLFYIACGLMLISLSCFILLYVINVMTVMIKLIVIFSFIILIPILIILYIILFGKNAVVICSNCRRIKYDGKYYVLEDFISNLSHDLCADCANIYNSIGMREKHRNKYKKRIYYG